MVSISRNRVKSMKLRSRTRNNSNNRPVDKAKAGIAAVFVLSLSLALWMTLFSSSSQNSETQQDKARRKETTLTHPDLRIHRKSSSILAETGSDSGSRSNSDNSDSNNSHPDLDQEHYNAIALDIIRTLQCQDAFDEVSKRLAEENKQADKERVHVFNAEDTVNEGKYRDIKQRRRRLEEDNESPDDLRVDKDGGGMDMDDEFGGDDFYQAYQPELKARYLFCLAAYEDPSVDEGASYFREHIHCDASNTRRQTLLDLWDTARAAFRNTELLTQVVDVAIEQEITLLKESLHVWAPNLDEGMQFTLATLNDEKHINADHGGLYGLSHNLGKGKFFVDVGSCLGFVSMAVTLMYPGTHIISIEAASPNWLMQELNWRCQPENSVIAAAQEPLVTRLLAGVGPVTGGAQFSLMLWRSDATTSTRSWTANSQRKDSDVELNVELKPWHSLLAQVGLSSSHAIDVLYIDCEGCEYNFVPSMSESEFQSIPTVIGEMHWGYIPRSKVCLTITVFMDCFSFVSLIRPKALILHIALLTLLLSFDSE